MGIFQNLNLEIDDLSFGRKVILTQKKCNFNATFFNEKLA